MNPSHPLKFGPLVSVAGLLFLTTSCADARDKPFMQVPAHFNRAPASYALAGPIHEQLQGVIDNWLLVAADRNPAMLEMFADRDKQPPRDLLPWSGEFAGKYLTGCTQVLRVTHDAGLQAKTQKFVDKLVTLQDEDGYFGPFDEAHRFKAVVPGVPSREIWDAWGHYHLMVGLLMWNEETGDAKALRSAEKIGDVLCNRFLGKGRHVADVGWPDQNQAVIHGLCLLYEKTGTQRYLDLAEQIVKEFEIPGAGDYLRTALAGQEFFATPRPRWESLHAILGLAELYRITGKEEYRKAFEHIWWSIVKLDRHNNGGFSSGEQATGNPYNRAPIETCCTIAWLATSIEMLRTTGSSVVADEMELSTLNSVVGLHEPSGKWSTYNTPMDGRRIPSTQDISFQIRPGSEQLNCCSVNAARGFGMISDWGLMTETGANGVPSALVLNWYGPSTLSSSISGTGVTLRQETEYPRNGRIVLHVDPKKAAKFSLKLRVPYWSEKTKVAVNGVEVPVRAGTYCVLNRQWKPGDQVTLDLDMRLRAWSGEREATGEVSLYRGPLLLAHEKAGASPTQRPGEWQSFGEIFASRKKATAFEYDFEGEGIKWFGHYNDDAGLSRVIIDGKTVALVDQYGPERGKPFSWEYKGLTPGKHTLRIEVSGDKVDASRDTWGNVLGFGEPGAQKPWSISGLDQLDFKTATAKLVTAAPENTRALAVVDVTDAKGKTVRLRDFGLAGQEGRVYSSWLPAKNTPATSFSKANPLRSVSVQEVKSTSR